MRRQEVKEQESLELLNSGYPAPVDESKGSSIDGSTSFPSKASNPPRMDVWFSLKPTPAPAPTMPPKELSKPAKSSAHLSPAVRSHESENVGNNSTAAHILPWFVHVPCILKTVVQVISALSSLSPFPRFASNPHPDLPPPRLKPKPQSVEYSPHHKAFIKKAKKTRKGSGKPKKSISGKTRLRPPLQHTAPAVPSQPENGQD